MGVQKILKKILDSLKLKHHKNTEDLPARDITLPDKVVVPMQMHIGRPAKPVVKVGEVVLVGQLIGEAEGLSAKVHSPVSGKVTALDEVLLPVGRTQAITITTDKEQTLHPDVAPPAVTDRDSFLKAVENSGIVGLGGAGFPTFFKLNLRDGVKVDTLLLNGAECEPYITSDYRTMLDRTDDMISGIEATLKYINIPKAVIVIEENKPKAISMLKERLKGTNISVLGVSSTYPQGAEKVLIYHATGRVTPMGKLPFDVNVVVMNVTTAAEVGAYLRTGMPLVEKMITVDGSAVKKPANLRVPIGTPMMHIFNECDGFKEEPGKIMMGGPMMGIAVYDKEYPLIKQNNAILAFNQADAKLPDETACIKCGRCVSACPFDLMPANIEFAYKNENIDELRRLAVGLCMECGCCSYVCPARRNLVETNRAAKAISR